MLAVALGLFLYTVIDATKMWKKKKQPFVIFDVALVLVSTHFIIA